MNIPGCLTVLPLLLAPGAVLAQAGHPPLDPACFAAVAWEVDPEAEPIQVFGCREDAEIPAPDAQGWIHYDRPSTDGSDNGFIWAKMGSVSADGVWTFTVQDNGGGSGTFESVVTGKPDMNGIMPVEGLKVDPVAGD